MPRTCIWHQLKPCIIEMPPVWSLSTSSCPRLTTNALPNARKALFVQEELAKVGLDAARQKYFITTNAKVTPVPSVKISSF